MKLSMRWLSDYVSYDGGLKEYIDRMTMSGSKVEGYEKEDENIKNVLVGRVLSVEKHPDADTLYICKIDVGDKEVQIVTGADNVVKGALVPVALHKSLLPNGTKITRGKLRGEVSEGMLCSLDELNLSIGDFPYANEDGILLIEEDCNVGDKVEDALGINDTIVEFEITSNRPDCLSVLGLARETAATYGKKIIIPEATVKAEGGRIQDYLSVKVENTELCPRYMAAVVEDVKIEKSPRWLRERLRASGVRPINNIVDITNFVMLEYGHPMHAFDLRHVAGNQIIVRNAKEGEKITTLDGEERELSSEMLVIADEKSPSAVAGVMGGEYSGVYDDTKVIVFEAAAFQRASVRRTAKKLGMRTESSGRFEKGLDSRNCELALKRACQLVEMLGAGKVAKEFIDEDFDKKPLTEIPFKPDWINSFVGVDIPKAEMVTILENLHFKVEGDKVVAPSFRGDMALPADVAEEVARIYGYDKIPTTTLRGESKGLITQDQHFRSLVSDVLIAQGFSEIITYSFFSPKNNDKIRLEEKSPLRNNIEIRNPLGEDTSVMRTTALPSMLMALSYNYNNRNQTASLFEIASVYHHNEDTTQLPYEPLKIVLGQYGEEADFFTLKGGVESVLNKGKVKDVKWIAVKDNATFHPGRCAKLVIKGEDCGILGEIHPLVAESYELGEHTYIAELDYALIFKSSDKETLFTPLPRYPASTRDLALVADRALPVGDIEEIIIKSAGKILEKLEIFDVYTGERISSDKKSVAYALTLRANDRTLTDEECDSLVEKTLNALKEISVEIRS